MPSNGIIWHGREPKATKARLNSDLKNVEQLLKGLRDTLNSEAPPKPILDEHCQVCEFRLQALAIRDKKIYILGKPELP